MTLKEELSNSIASIEAERQAIWKLKEPMDARLYNLSEQLQDKRNRLDKIELEERPNDWEFLLTAGASTIRYEACEKALAVYGLRSSCYFRETNQNMIQIGLYKHAKSKNAKQLEGLKEILPYLKYNKDGYISVSIFEHTLSEYQSYDMRIYKDNSISVGGRWHSNTFTTLEEAFEYIRKNHWYDDETED